LSAHAATGDLIPVALPVDDLHLAAAALWLGGLAMLLVNVLRPDGPVAADQQAGIVERFSRLAFWCVVVLVATGSFQSWRQVRELDAFTTTTYGRTLLVKLGLFAALVGLAGVSRSFVRRRQAGGRLRRAVLAEVAVATAVLAATAMLVNAVPARSAVSRPVTKELSAGGGKVIVDVTIDPAKAGPATIHLYSLTPTGQVAEVQEATVTLRLPAKGIGPLEVPLSRAGPGHFAAYAFELPLAGQWRLEVSVRTSEIDVFRAATTVRIR
jgi:copper transport protein